MNLSLYFEDLTKAYRAEIEDLQSDSDGKNVLAVRLSQKRAQFKMLMSMIEFAPEMVAPAFHGGISFRNPHAMVLLSFAEPEEFPSWESLLPAVQLEAWAEKLVAIALLETGGERFLITMLCLEFLHEKQGDRDPMRDDSSEEEEEEHRTEEDGDGERDRSDDELPDLDQAGIEWMSDQGFDRRD